MQPGRKESHNDKHFQSYVVKMDAVNLYMAHFIISYTSGMACPDLTLTYLLVFRRKVIKFLSSFLEERL